MFSCIYRGCTSSLFTCTTLINTDADQYDLIVTLPSMLLCWVGLYDEAVESHLLYPIYTKRQKKLQKAECTYKYFRKCFLSGDCLALKVSFKWFIGKPIHGKLVYKTVRDKIDECHPMTYFNGPFLCCLVLLCHLNIVTTIYWNVSVFVFWYHFQIYPY